jgi:hypothetical protein
MSSDLGKTWTHKAELDGSSQVVNEYIGPGELWQFVCTPYEKIAMSKSGDGENKKPVFAGTTPPLEGQPGWSQVYIGKNGLPKLAIKSYSGSATSNGKVKYTIKWTYSDPEGQTCTVAWYWSKIEFFSLQPLIGSLSAKTGAVTSTASLPTGKPFYLYGVITDAKGAINHTVVYKTEISSAADGSWKLYQ